MRPESVEAALLVAAAAEEVEEAEVVATAEVVEGSTEEVTSTEEAVVSAAADEVSATTADVRTVLSVVGRGKAGKLYAGMEKAEGRAPPVKPVGTPEGRCEWRSCSGQAACTPTVIKAARARLENCILMMVDLTEGRCVYVQ